MITRREMTKLMGVAAAGALAPTLALAQSGSSLERVRSSGRLRIGGIADGAPYYQRDLATGEWRGFYIDICQALADDLGLTLDVTETTWGNSVLDLQSNRLDVFFGLNPTPERQQVIDFSGPVFRNAFTVLVREGFEPETWEDLNSPDVRVAVDIGSSNDAAATRHLPNAQITRLRTASEATTALLSGRVDAQCLVLVLALTVRKSNPAVGNVVVPTPVDATTSNAGFRREADTSWKEFVDNWITERRESGFVHQAVVSNMELVGVSEEDLPDGFTL